VGSSAIRDILHVTERPEIISMAGGLPDPATFPVGELEQAFADVLRDDAAASLQYSATAGYLPLREWICAEDPERVVVTAGSQQALDLVSRCVLQPGAVVALADPAYVGALQSFRLAEASLEPIPSDVDGMAVDVLADRCSAGLHPALVYVVANFDNPTGATLSLERRRALAALAERYGFLIVEDDPYGALRWAGPTPPSMATMTDRVVGLSTFSKVLSPGLRIGWAVAPPALRAEMIIVKQALDLHTSSLTQRAAHRVVSAPGFLNPHLARIRALYESRATTLDAALQAHLADALSWTAPQGGMFVWADAAVETGPLLARAVEAGVAFVPGSAFAVRAGDHAKALRLSFATVSPAELEEGVLRLRKALRT
jgi:2-aminoadipate transaminase